MEVDFKTPQRQSVSGIVIMFADSFQKAIRALWAPLLLILFKLEPEKYLVVGIGFIILLVCVGIIAYLKYRNFIFYLDEEKKEFVVKKGILNKSIISIQLSKIQQVNINQSVIQKIIGVFSLDIDTAGSDKKEISIRAIDEKLALILKERLLDNADVKETNLDESVIDAYEEKATAKPFIKISYSTLFKVGITSNYARTIALIITFLATLYESLKDFVRTLEMDDSQIDSVFERGMGFFSAGIIIFVVLILVLLINIIRTFIKHFDFEMVKQRNSLAISSGLFAKKNTLLNPLKVQITSFSQNFFQRKLQILDMHTKQASSRQVGNQQNKLSNVIEIPGCNSYERDEILKIILGKIPEKGSEQSPNFRYIIKGVNFGIIFPIAIYLTFAFIFKELQDYYPLIFVYLGLVGLLIYFGFKNYRLYSNPEFVIKKSGAWDVEHQIIQPHKIQAITTKQFFWHKKSDVGHLVLHTAAGDVSFRFGKFIEIKQLVNFWMYQVEISKEKWM